ncbi:MAG: hypothetical protein V1661_00865 [bacterium]
MSILKLLFIDTILDVLYFPLWWYSRGAVLAFKWVLKEIGETENFLAVHIWVANLFRPMYGQSDIGGKIISFFMRLFQIIFRSIAFLGFSGFYFALFLVYLLLPVFVIYGISLHLPSLLK